MTSAYRAWPCWAVMIFGGLALVRLLPGGCERAVVAVPILLTVPGVLTLGAIMARERLHEVTFCCLALLLSVLWTVFASLALYLLHVLITADSTYWCLLAICAVLGVIAQARLLAGRPAGSRPPVPLRGTGYAVAALAAGAGLLGGATYSYLHLPHPAPAGYTWIAWSGRQVKGVIAVGPGGTTLPFQIEHYQRGMASFDLTAAWTGTSQQHALARPVTLHIGPDKTMNGALSIPSPPGACAYRIVVTLTSQGSAHPRSWSINADVRAGTRRQQACAS